MLVQQGRRGMSPRSHVDQHATIGIQGAMVLPRSVTTADLSMQPIGGHLVEMVLPNPVAPAANAPVHPSLLEFPYAWNGYRYWLAFTPYPGYDSTYENPCVVASNDLVSWVQPAPNPLVAKPTGGYNADTHLFMSPDGARMYLAFRERITGGNNNLKIMHTDNGGLSWSAPVTVLSGAQGVTDFASPSLWWNGTTWTCISHQLDAASPWPVRRNVSSTSDIYGAWGAATTVTVPPLSGRAWWHSFHVRLASGQVVGMFMDNNGTSGSSGTVYLAESGDDGASYSITRQVYSAGGKYRSTFSLRNDGSMNVIVSDFAALKLYHFQARSGARERAAAFLARHSTALLLPTNLPPGAIWADAFTRADSAVTPGTADSGGTYTVSSGTWGISSNRLYPVASGRLLAAAGTSEHIVSVKFLDITTSIQQWVIARAVDGSNYWRIGVTTPTASGTQTLAIQNIVAGVIGAVNKGISTFQRGDTVAVEASGALLRVFVNGFPVHEELCITAATGASFGVQANAGANTFFDNLTCLSAS